MQTAAGILLNGPYGRSLFLKRSDTGMWATPAGHVEAGETPWKAAQRETFEETGYSGPFIDAKLLQKTYLQDLEFFLYTAKVPQEFVPNINSEHTGFVWTSVQDIPSPLHWGLKCLTKRS